MLQSLQTLVLFNKLKIFADFRNKKTIQASIYLGISNINCIYEPKKTMAKIFPYLRTALQQNKTSIRTGQK